MNNDLRSESPDDFEVLVEVDLDDLDGDLTDSDVLDEDWELEEDWDEDLEIPNEEDEDWVW